MKIQRRWQSIVAVMLALFSSSSFADYTLNMREGVSELSKEIFDLHMFVLWICVVIGVVVFGLMIYSMINHRKSKHPVPADFHESTKVEILWTVIPLLILLVVAVPATKTLIKLEDASDSDVYIKVTGYQWKWHYDYIDEGVSFFSQISDEGNAARQLGADPALRNDIALGENGKDKYLLDVDNPLVVPVGKKIGFLVTSNDVIHAWWAPDLAVKQDAVPGYINDTWAIVDKPGVYRGQCAELCGKDHGFMPVVVVAKTEEDYAAWLAEKKSGAAAAAADSGRVFTKDELMAKGEGLYAKNCAVCHGAEGVSAVPFFPSLKDNAIAVGPIGDHVDVVFNGSKTNPAMAAWGAQLSDADLAAIITYERNAWGNDAGDMIQPADIAKLR